MAFRKKCKVCNSCMSPVWKDADRYMYCGFCRQYYAGHIDNLVPVDSPFTPTVIENFPMEKAYPVDDPTEEENANITDTNSP